MLTHWARDRKRGPGLALEFVVKRQTSETADFFGFNDRGRLQPGKRADINVIDFEALRLHPPEVVQRPAGRRQASGAARRRLCRNPRCRRPGLRARPSHRRPSRPAGAARWRSRHPQPRLSGTSAIFRSVAGRKGCPAPLFPLLSARNLQPAIHLSPRGGRRRRPFEGRSCDASVAILALLCEPWPTANVASVLRPHLPRPP